MTQIFLSLFNVSATATWIVLVILALRLCLKKAPRWITCLLWGVVGLRLILPYSIESPLSLIPSTQIIPQDIAMARDPAIFTGITALDQAINPVIEELFAPQELASINPLQVILPVLTIVWLVGIVVMLLCATVSSVRLYRMVRTSVYYRDNSYLCDDVDTPFILGIIKPRIFLPSGIEPEQTEAVIAHELAHLKRKDHWWKPLGYCLLTVYWYNPVFWVAYILLCRDVELACDERVIKSMDAQAKKVYSQALADCSCNRRIIMACPLSFGEVGVKARIKAVLHYNKPTVWMIGFALIVTVILTACFLTDPLDSALCNHEYHSEMLKDPTCASEGEMLFCCKYCSDNYKEPIPRTEHKFRQLNVLQEPDCLHAGSAEYACAICGKQETRQILPKPHTLGAFTVIKEATSGVDGEKSSWCSICGREIVYPIKWNEAQEKT